MFPTTGDLHIAPFSDDALHMEQFSKANFWYQQSFHGVDLTSLRRAAIEEYFKQPIVVRMGEVGKEVIGSATYLVKGGHDASEGGRLC